MRKFDGEFMGDQTKLPPEIICCVCKRSRPSYQYSNNQIAKLRRVMYHDDGFNLGKQLVVKCGPCTNSQIVELKCHKCGHILEISQFSKNQRIREEPLCQPCMDYQQSLDAGGNLPSLEPPEEEEDNDFANLQSLTEDVGSILQGGEMPDPDTALVRRSESVVGIGDESPKGNSGFDKIKAHRAFPTLVNEPTPAPGWTSDAPKVDADASWKGYTYI